MNFKECHTSLVWIIDEARIKPALKGRRKQRDLLKSTCRRWFVRKFNQSCENRRSDQLQAQEDQADYAISNMYVLAIADDLACAFAVRLQSRNSRDDTMLEIRSQ